MPRTMFLEGSTRSTRRTMRFPPVSARSWATDRVHSGLAASARSPSWSGEREETKVGGAMVDPASSAWAKQARNPSAQCSA